MRVRVRLVLRGHQETYLLDSQGEVTQDLTDAFGQQFSFASSCR